MATVSSAQEAWVVDDASSPSPVMSTFACGNAFLELQMGAQHLRSGVQINRSIGTQTSLSIGSSERRYCTPQANTRGSEGTELRGGEGARGGVKGGGGGRVCQ